MYLNLVRVLTCPMNTSKEYLLASQYDGKSLACGYFVHPISTVISKQFVFI